MKKLSLKFMNCLERAVFKNFPEDYTPISAIVAKSTLLAAFASIIVIFFLQMFNVDESSANIVLGIAYGLALLFSGWITWKAMKCLPSTGSKIGLAAYVLVLFTMCMLLFIWLAVWVVMIALVALVGWIILKVAFPDKSGKKTVTTHWNDSRTIEMESTGKGILGEEYFEGEGRTHIEP